MDNISTSRQEQLTIIEKGPKKGKEKAMPKGKENVDPVVQLLRKNVGVVIHEARDFNPICIRTEQEKGKEKVQAKGKRHATSMTTENIDLILNGSYFLWLGHASSNNQKRKNGVMDNLTMFEQVPLHQNNIGIVIREEIDVNAVSTNRMVPLHRNNIGIVIREEIDVNAISLCRVQVGNSPVYKIERKLGKSGFGPV